MALRVKRLVLRVKQLALRVKRLVLRVKQLALRVKHLTLRVKQCFMTPMAYHIRAAWFCILCNLSILLFGRL